MKKLFFLTVLFTVLFLGCTKKTQNIDQSTLKNDSVTIENDSYIVTESTDSDNAPYNSVTVISEKDNRPDEIDIAGEHKLEIEDWYSKNMSEDEKYLCYENGEMYSVYNRYCIPVEGDRKDLNLIMLKEDCTIINPKDLGSNKMVEYNSGCEFVAISRSEKVISYKGKNSYWFKVANDRWLPGISLYIQTGIFDKLPVEELEIGLDYEEIEGGKWFTVNTDDGSSLRLRDSSNIKEGKVINNLPQGTWVYADSQTSQTEEIDNREGHWYKIIYPKTGYVFGGYLESKDGVPGLEFAMGATFIYGYDSSKDYIYKIYSAPTIESECLGEYEIKPEGKFYSFIIQTKTMEIIDGKEGEWVYVMEPVKGFIFGDRFIYK